MTRGSITEYAEAVRGRYLGASKKEKGRILDEFTENTGYHRKAAIRLLHQRTQRSLGKRRGRPRGITSGTEVSKPLIAAINGYCLAGGQKLALACDIRIASETARFGAPEVKRGILHGYGALRLVHAIPMASAMEMPLTGDMIDAKEALRIGLVSRVVPPSQLMPTAEAIAQRICENSPIAVRAIKDLAYRGLGMPLEQGLRYYAHVNRLVRASEDAKEGPRAFAEKRKADFKGR